MADVRIRIDDQSVRDYLQTHGPRKVHNALRSAIRTTTTWSEKETDRRLAAETAIPIQVFRRFRVKKKLFGGSAASGFGGGGSVESGLIWSGYNPVKARFVGKLAQDEGGASAGAYYFGGAFVASMRGGLTAIFKRRGKKRLPIDEQKVNIHQAEAIAAAVAGEAEQELLRRFRAKFTES